MSVNEHISHCYFSLLGNCVVHTKHYFLSHRYCLIALAKRFTFQELIYNYTR